MPVRIPKPSTRPGRLGVAVALAGALAAGLVAAPGAGAAPTHQPAVFTDGAVRTSAAAALAAVESGEASFTLALTARLAAHNPGDTVVSPLSAAAALGMLELGAGGPTESGIAKALATSGLSPDEQAGAWRVLAASLAASGRQVTVQLADSVWLQQGFPVKHSFLRAVAADFAGAAYRTDFAHAPAAAAAAINAWVSAKTDGHIRNLFSASQLEGAALVLANALHFEAKWSPDFTSVHERFSTGPHAAEQVKAITSSEAGLRYSTSGGVTAVAIPYRGGRYQAVVLEPSSGTLGAFLGSLSPARYAALLAGMHRGQADLTMPTLDLQTHQSLDGVLSALGMGSAFSGSADFSPISSQPVAVSDVEQADLLKVTRVGTEADAATGVVVSPTAVAPGEIPAITIDHPYLLLVRDSRTGTVLMTAVVNNPSDPS